MKSPQFIKVTLVAIILAAIGYFISNSFELNATQVAASLFIGAFLSPFLIAIGATNQESDNQEVKTLYVGNLPYRANEAAVRELFSPHGFVHSVRLMKDKHTGKRRGFGFVEISVANIDTVISALNDQEFQQRTLKVREAKERPERTETNE